MARAVIGVDAVPRMCTVAGIRRRHPAVVITSAAVMTGTLVIGTSQRPMFAIRRGHAHHATPQFDEPRRVAGSVTEPFLARIYSSLSLPARIATIEW